MEWWSDGVMRLSGTVIRLPPGDEGFRLTSTPALQYSNTPVLRYSCTPATPGLFDIGK
jgi:hypothetical protein